MYSPESRFSCPVCSNAWVYRRSETQGNTKLPRIIMRSNNQINKFLHRHRLGAYKKQQVGCWGLLRIGSRISRSHTHTLLSKTKWKSIATCTRTTRPTIYVGRYFFIIWWYRLQWQQQRNTEKIPRIFSISSVRNTNIRSASYVRNGLHTTRLAYPTWGSEGGKNWWHIILRVYGYDIIYRLRRRW